jgi:hypothetical protein
MTARLENTYALLRYFDRKNQEYAHKAAPLHGVYDSEPINFFLTRLFYSKKRMGANKRDFRLVAAKVAVAAVR